MSADKIKSDTCLPVFERYFTSHYPLNKESISSKDICMFAAVQNERDRINCRRPSYEEPTQANGLSVVSLLNAELLSRKVIDEVRTLLIQHISAIDIHTSGEATPGQCRAMSRGSKARGALKLIYNLLIERAKISPAFEIKIK